MKTKVLERKNLSLQFTNIPLGPRTTSGRLSNLWREKGRGEKEAEKKRGHRSLNWCS